MLCSPWYFGRLHMNEMKVDSAKPDLPLIKEIDKETP